MRAAAALTVEGPLVGTGRIETRIRRLRSDVPLVLRPTGEPPGRTAPLAWNLDRAATLHVALVAGAAGPVGGDNYHLDVHVGSNATLVLRAVAATIALPGPRGERSRMDVTIHVAESGTLVWLPGTLIAAANCDHESTTTVTLDAGARLLLREELVLGRHGESAGQLRQRVRVLAFGRAVYDQDLHVGPDAPGWRGTAVTAGHRALGSVLLVDAQPNNAGPRTSESGDGWARMPLGDSAVLVSAVAPDAPTLRGRLDECFDTLDPATDDEIEALEGHLVSARAAAVMD